MTVPWKKATAAILLAFIAAIGFAGCSQESASEPQADSYRDALRLSEESFETLGSLEKVAENLYAMEYSEDYDLDRLLSQGAEDERALGEFVSETVLYGLPFHKQPPDANLGCSTFTAQAPDGSFIQGRNYDIDGIQNIIVHTQPEQGYSSLSTASGLFLGYDDSLPEGTVGRLNLLAAPYYPIDGINEKGVSIAMLWVYGAPHTDQETGKPSITSTLAIRLVLDKAASVAEAVDLLGHYDMYGVSGTNIHFHIADSSGDSAIVEYVDDEMRVLRAEGYGQVATNYFLSPDAEELYFDGAGRLATLQAALDAAKGVVSVDEAWGMLEAVKAVHDYDEATGMDFNTSCSIVFDNTRRTLSICANMDYGLVYHFEVDSGAAFSSEAR